MAIGRIVKTCLQAGSERTERLHARYLEKKARGEIKPEENSGQQGTAQNQKPRKLTVGDLRLPFISAHIS